MDFLAKLGAVLVSGLTVAVILSKAISGVLERNWERWYYHHTNTPEGERHWFSRNDDWWRDRHGKDDDG